MYNSHEKLSFELFRHRFAEFESMFDGFTDRLFSIFYRCFLSIHDTFVVESFETIDVCNGKRNKFDFFSV